MHTSIRLLTIHHWQLTFPDYICHVKVFAWIMAFYLLLLSAVPCCAFDDCPDDKTEQTASHENGDDDCGNCSPFFSCEGCAVTGFVYPMLSFEQIISEAAPVFGTYTSRLLHQTHGDFWQPPKLI